MNNHAGRCILFHHMGNGVEIAVGCRGCVRKRVMRVYGNEIPNPKLECFDFGRSKAAVERFLSDRAFGRNVALRYNSKYRDGAAYYAWCSTNCCRLTIDLLFYLKLDYSIAWKITGEMDEIRRRTGRRCTLWSLRSILNSL